jgi:long-chain acyl-CoA synthetase
MGPDPEGLLARLHAVALTRGAATAIRDGATEWSYAHLLDEVEGLVGRVASAAPASGARFGLVCANGAEFVAAFFAILGAGGVVSLNPALQERELAASLRAAGLPDPTTRLASRPLPVRPAPPAEAPRRRC